MNRAFFFIIFAFRCLDPLARGQTPLDQWTISNSDTNGVHFEIKDGEAGGSINTSPLYHYIADTRIGGRLRRTEPIRGAGHFHVKIQAPPNRFNGFLHIGHFETSGLSLSYSDFVGLYLQEGFSSQPGTMRLQAGARLNNGGLQLGPILTVTNDTDYAFGYTWDPAAGVNGAGRLSCAITNPAGQVMRSEVDLPASAFGFACNAFGISSGYQMLVTNATVQVWISNPTYTTIPKPPPLPPYTRVFLLIGQSNARGADSALATYPASDWANRNTYFFTDPEWTWLRPGVPLQNFFGPEIVAASDLSEKLQAPVAFVKYAIGGKGLYEEFLPSLNLSYPLLVDRTKRALAQLDRPIFSGVFTVQGENDGNDPAGAALFLTNMLTLKKTLETDLGETNMPFVITRLQIWCGDAYKSTIRKAQEAFGHWVNTDDLPGLDIIHFTTAAQFEIGHRFAARFLEDYHQPIFRKFGDQVVLISVPGYEYAIEQTQDFSSWKPFLPSVVELSRGPTNIFYRAVLK